MVGRYRLQPRTVGREVQLVEYVVTRGLCKALRERK